MNFKNYRKKNVQPMRPYIPGEDLSGVSVNDEDTLEEGGMIAVNPANPADMWYVGKQFFADNYIEVAWSDELISKSCAKRRNIMRTQDKIDDVVNRCAERIDEGGSQFPNLSFEEGVRDAIAWLQDEGPHPLGDEN